MYLSTPSNKDGSINLEILKQCIAEISDAKNEESNPIILIRSTILPGTSRQLQEQFPKLRIVFNPEFQPKDQLILILFLNHALYLVVKNQIHLL